MYSQLIIASKVNPFRVIKDPIWRLYIYPSLVCIRVCNNIKAKSNTTRYMHQSLLIHITSNINILQTLCSSR